MVITLKEPIMSTLASKQGSLSLRRALDPRSAAQPKFLSVQWRLLCPASELVGYPDNKSRGIWRFMLGPLIFRRISAPEDKSLPKRGGLQSTFTPGSEAWRPQNKATSFVYGCCDCCGAGQCALPKTFRYPPTAAAKGERMLEADS